MRLAMDIQEELFKYIHTSDTQRVYSELRKAAIMPPFAECLHRLINTKAPGISSIGRFVKSSHCRKWSVFSDYIFNGQDVNNDVVSFAIIPFLSKENYDWIRAHIKEKIPHDSKCYSTSNPIPEEVAVAINETRTLAVSFVLPKKWHLFGDKTTDLTRIRIFLDTIMKCLLVWAKNAPSEDRQSQHLQNCSIIKDFLDQPESMWKLPKTRQVLLVSILAAFIRFLVEKICRGGQIMWGTDRDAIFEWPDGKHKGTIYAIEECLLHNFLVSEGLADLTSFMYAEPIPEPGSESLWYDEFNRLADFAAGALAMLNTTSKTVPSSKFNHYFRHVIADNPRFVTFLFNPTAYSCKELDFTSADSQ